MRQMKQRGPSPWNPPPPFPPGPPLFSLSYPDLFSLPYKGKDEKAPSGVSLQPRNTPSATAFCVSSGDTVLNQLGSKCLYQYLPPL